MADQTLATIRTNNPATAFAGTELVYITQSGADAGALTSDFKTLAVGAGTVSVASGKTLTASNTLTFTGTDSSSVNFGAGGTVSYGGGLTVGTSTITSGTTLRFLYDNAGVLGETAGLTFAGTGQLALALGTITTNLKAINITGTWNAGGITFDAPLFMNITDTASAVGSSLVDIQKGGSSLFRILNTTSSNDLSPPNVDITTTGLSINAGVYSIRFATGGATYLDINGSNGIDLSSAAGDGGMVAWNSAANWGSTPTPDTAIFRNAAGVVEVNTGTAGTFGTWRGKYRTVDDTTGAGTVAGFGTNSPATTVTAPYTWLKFTSTDGSTVYVPAYK